MSRPSVAIVLLEPIWPARNGIGRRLEAIVDQLAAVCALTVLSCLPRSAPDPAPPPTVDHVRIERAAGRPGALAGMVTALLHRRPLTAAFYRRASCRRRLRAVLAALGADLVLTHGIGGAVLVEGLVPRQRILLDLADWEPERVTAVGRSAGLSGLPYRLDGRRVARWCARFLPEYRMVSVVSDADAARYSSLTPSARLVVVPNGVTCDANDRAAESGRVLFIGDLRYPPNRAGVDWFITQVLPLCPPDLELVVAGLGDLAAGDPRVVRLGFVDDLRDELARAEVFVVPITLGGGTRIKALQAFAAGIPVVSTRFGVGGLGVEPGVHYLAAETAEEFALAVAFVRDDPGAARAMAEAAQQHVERSLTWDLCMTPLRREVLAAGAEGDGSP